MWVRKRDKLEECSLIKYKKGNERNPSKVFPNSQPGNGRTELSDGAPCARRQASVYSYTAPTHAHCPKARIGGARTVLFLPGSCRVPALTTLGRPPPTFHASLLLAERGDVTLHHWALDSTREFKEKQKRENKGVKEDQG